MSYSVNRHIRKAIRNSNGRAYAVTVEYSGWIDVLDERIFDLAGGRSEDSRYAFGRRDHTWYFKYKKEADKLLKRLNMIHHVGLSVRRYEF